VLAGLETGRKPEIRRPWDVRVQERRHAIAVHLRKAFVVMRS
jgi:hypothetical protein